MRTIRIYQAGFYSVGEILELSPEAGQHVGVVLRMQPEDTLTLFSGDNRELTARILAVHKKKVSVKIEAEQLVNRESPRIIHLAQAISKGERMELVMQKAVELGVSSISPIWTERSIAKWAPDRMEKREKQWQAIVVAACEQSGRNQIPKVKNALVLEEFLQQTEPGLKLVLDPKGSKTWRDYQFGESELTLLIGPEGGLSSNELEHIISAGFNPLCFGPRILRTETAAITALSVLQAVCGDL